MSFRKRFIRSQRRRQMDQWVRTEVEDLARAAASFDCEHIAQELEAMERRSRSNRLVILRGA